MLRRRPAVPWAAVDIAWKAQVRLCRRHWQLVIRRKKAPAAVMTVASELVGFIWVIARQVQPV